MKTLSSIVFLLCMTLLSFSQTTITGKVLDANNQTPLIGATIVALEDPKIGTITDADGKFTFSVRKNIQTLSISYTGYETQEIAVTGRTYVEIQLQVSATELEELLVVGYGTQARADVSGSIAQIKEETIENTPVVSLEEALQGQAPGLFISSKNGKLGSKLNVNIRGITSINAGSEPLYVVDGVLVNSQEQMLSSNPNNNPLSNLDLNDVASVEILKDASAAAIYGSRASNGVIIINTKQGQAGETRIELDIQKGWSAPTRKREWLNAEQYLELWEEAFNNVAAPDGTLFGATADNWRDNFLPEWDQGHDTDWEEVMYNENAGLERVNLNISGGSESTKFYISGGYQDQVGTIITDDLQRISTRINLDHQVSSVLGLGVNLALSRNRSPFLASDNNFFSPGQIIANPSVQPLFDPQNEGKLFTNTLYFNSKLGEQEVDAKDIQYRSLGKFYLDIKPFNWLDFRSEFGFDLFDSDRSVFFSSRVARLTGEPQGDKFNIHSTALNYSTTSYFTIRPTLSSGHESKITLGTSFQKLEDSFLFVSGRNFPNDEFQNLNSAGEIDGGNAEKDAFSILSYFSRFNYSYQGKYLLNLSARIDGDSRFGANSRYGFFPAGSFAWVLSKEDFLNQNKWLSSLKLRASWGQTGNTPIERFAALSLFRGTRYVGNSGTVQSQIANPDLSWEKTTQTNVGIDFGLWNDRISGQADYYIKNTTDLLLDVNIPYTTGFVDQLQNIGAIKNEGVELSLTSYNLVGSFKWETILNFSRNKNEAIDLNGQFIDFGDFARTLEGHPIGSFFVPEFAGVDPANGDELFYLNTELENGQRDRTTTNNINEAERVVVGNPQPDFIYGIQNSFSWKGIQLSVLLQGVYGNEIYNAAGIFQLNGFNWFDNQDIRVLNRWQQPGDETDIPQLRFLGNTFNSSRFLENGTYLRLKNVRLSYQIPSAIIQKIGLQQLSFYCIGQNLLTFTDYGGWDPEVNTDVTNFGDAVNLGIDFYSLPPAKTLLIGIKAGF